MINFAGIVTTPGASTPDLLSTMTNALRGPSQSLAEGAVQLAWSGQGAGGAAHLRETELIVAFQGTPWLDDTELSGHAARVGLGQAIAVGYRRYGEAVLEKLKGHFALAVIDPHAPQVLVATDRFAVRRIHVAVTDAAIYFGTALDPLVAANPELGEVSLEALYRYLYFYSIPSPFTIYTPIARLEPGKVCTWTPHGARTRRFWAPAFGAAADYGFENAKERFFQTLDASIGRACNNDGAYGAFLSGGLDSSAVVGMMARYGAKPCFHVSFDTAAFDESAYAKRAAEWFDVPLHDTRLTPQAAFDILVDLTRHFDEPFGNSSAIPTTLCARLARENGVTTMLAGDGGDELFAGNERYVRQKQITTWQRRVPRWLRNILAGIPAPLQRSVLRKLARASELTEYSVGERILEGTALLKADPHEVLHPDIAETVRAHGPVDDLESYARGCPHDNWLYQLLYVDMKYTLADNDLRKVGAACELAGIEVAYPMLDEGVADLALSVPPDDLIRGFRLRHFYKEAVTGFLPEEIINKPKQGFGMPFTNWIVEDPRFNRLADDALASLAGRHLLAPTYVEQMRHAIAGHGDRYSLGAAWDLIVLELWLSEREPRLP